jgi:outer membrane receptor protein involved in Fe transport
MIASVACNPGLTQFHRPMNRLSLQRTAIGTVGSVPRNWRRTGVLAAVAFAFSAASLWSQTPPSLPSLSDLKKMSLDQLMDIEVTSVSKRPEKLSEVASAIQVITGDDIRRAGATSIPEALRLASNLEVAQIDSRQWAITARGFNNVFADKMLVLIDGRSVTRRFTPASIGMCRTRCSRISIALRSSAARARPSGVPMP